MRDHACPVCFYSMQVEGRVWCVLRLSLSLCKKVQVYVIVYMVNVIYLSALVRGGKGRGREREREREFTCLGGIKEDDGGRIACSSLSSFFF